MIILSWHFLDFLDSPDAHCQQHRHRAAMASSAKAETDITHVKPGENYRGVFWPRFS